MEIKEKCHGVSGLRARVGLPETAPQRGQGGLGGGGKAWGWRRSEATKRGTRMREGSRLTDAAGPGGGRPSRPAGGLRRPPAGGSA
jgi:hypothetical protein